MLGVGRSGKTIVSFDCEVQVHAVETGELLFRQPSPDPVTTVALMPGGGSVWYGTEGGSLYRWNFAKELAPVKLPATRDRVTVIAFDRKGHAFTGDAAGNLRQWDLATNQSNVRRTGQGPVTACLVTADGQLVLGTWHDEAAAVLISPTGRISKNISTGRGNIVAASLTPDGSEVLLLSSRDGNDRAAMYSTATQKLSKE